SKVERFAPPTGETPVATRSKPFLATRSKPGRLEAAAFALDCVGADAPVRAAALLFFCHAACCRSARFTLNFFGRSGFRRGERAAAVGDFNIPTSFRESSRYSPVSTF